MSIFRSSFNHTHIALLSLATVLILVFVILNTNQSVEHKDLPPQFYLEQNTFTAKFRWCSTDIRFENYPCTTFEYKEKQRAIDDAWLIYEYLATKDKGEWKQTQP